MKKTLVTVLTVALLISAMLVPAASADNSTAKAYFTLVNIIEGMQVPMYTNSLFIDNGDGTYTLYQNTTLDITEASGGYLSTVGGGKVLFGECTVEEEDGETIYTLSVPTRVIASSYMMTGPANTVEIYVDSADSETYANYSPADITGMDEASVVEMLLKTSATGNVAEELNFNSTLVVDVDTFLITDQY